MGKHLHLKGEKSAAKIKGVGGGDFVYVDKKL